MKLKTRLTLFFLLLAWVPLGVVVWQLTDRMQDTFAASFEDQATLVRDTLGARLEQTARALSQALDAVAGDPLLRSHLLEPLAHGQFYGVREHERAIVREAQRLLRPPEIATLRIVDLRRGGHVVAIAHRSGEEPPDKETVRRANAGTRARIHYEHIENKAKGTADPAWTFQVLDLVGDEGRIALVGGRLLDEELLTDMLAGLSDVHVALMDLDGARLAATFEGKVPQGDQWYLLKMAVEYEGAALATLKVFVSRAELDRALRELWTTSGLLAGGTGLLALLAGILLSFGLSRRLESLAAAASRVADGERDVMVPRSRGRDEVAALTRAFNQMIEDLADGEERLRQSERVAAWRGIARRIAHEIKNPLFPIQMSIETLQKARARQHPDFDEIFSESTETILEEVERMKRIVTEFSNFARMPAPKPQPIDIVDAVRSVLKLHRDTVEGLALRQSGPEELTASVDPDQFRQVLVNLVQNAIDAASEGEGTEADPKGAVEVRVEPLGPDGPNGVHPSPRFRLTVTDTGPGIEHATMSKLFTPYFTTKANGTGLGLAIVHRIVEEHGGTIRVDSKPGVGTRFALELPAG